MERIRPFFFAWLLAGTPLAAYSEGVCDVSAGHLNHPSTTHSATEVVFAYLQQGVEGQVSMANAELRASLAWNENSESLEVWQLW